MGLQCRKCGGAHLTIKCGKVNNNKRNNNYKNNNNNKYKSNKTNVKHRGKAKFTIRMSNLPNDLRLAEVNKLMLDWGDIGKININDKNRNNKSVFIDFYIKEEAEYFVEAFDKTPFGNYIINVELLKK